jgi:CBS domain-containing protein
MTPGLGQEEPTLYNQDGAGFQVRLIPVGLEEEPMKARDLMTTDVISLAPDTPIQEIASIFRRRGISGAPVVEGGALIGIVTELDLIARHARPHSPLYLPLLGAEIPLGGQHEYREAVRRILGVTAREIMTAPVYTVDPEADLEAVATLMVESKANPVPVVEGGKLVGIIGHTDLICHLEEAEVPAEEGTTDSAG